MVPPGPAGLGEQKGEGLAEFALLARGGRLLVAAYEVSVPSEAHLGWICMCGLKPGVGLYKLLQLLCVSRASLGKTRCLKNRSTVKQSNVCIK